MSKVKINPNKAKTILSESESNRLEIIDLIDWKCISDPSFYNWLLDYPSNVEDYGIGMTDDQKSAVNHFLNFLKVSYRESLGEDKIIDFINQHM